MTTQETFQMSISQRQEAIGTSEIEEITLRNIQLQMLQLSMQLHHDQRQTEAKQIYRQILEQHPTHPEVLHGLAILAQKCEENQAAEQLLSAVVQIQPDAVKSWFSLGNLYHSEGQLYKAAEAYWQAVSHQPNSAVIYNNLGYTLQKLEQWEEAVFCYKKALKFQPNWLEVEVNLANVLHALGKLSEDEQLYYANLNSKLGMNSRESGDFKTAQLYLQQVIILQPNWWEGYYNLALILLEQDNFEQALIYCQKSLELNPDDDKVQTSLKKIYRQQNEYSAKISIDNISDRLENSIRHLTLEHDSESKCDIEILKKISGAIWNWAKTGFSKVDEVTFRKRYDTCMQCPHLAEVPKSLLYRAITANNTDEKICNLCGCVISKKIEVASESCPDKHPTQAGLNRWQEPIK